MDWIHQVSKQRAELNNFAVCPFASTSKYKIVECSADEIYPIDGYNVIIYIIEDHFNLLEVRQWIDHYNIKYSGWRFFEDCKTYDTFIKNIQTNNGKYNLIIGQPKKELRNFREKLSKTEYYALWDADYLKEILEYDYDLIEHRDRNLYKSSD